MNQTTAQDIQDAEQAVRTAQDAERKATTDADQVKYAALAPFRSARADAERTLDGLRKDASGGLKEGRTVSWDEVSGGHWNNKRKQQSVSHKRGEIIHVTVHDNLSLTYLIVGFLQDGGKGVKKYTIRVSPEGKASVQNFQAEPQS